MGRRLFLLNGLAILAVVLNHAAAFGQISMFWWTHRYRPVTVPNWDQLGTLPYYVLLVARGLGVFTVPAFLFLAGFFVAYAASANHSVWRWRVAGLRIKSLLVPYLLWSAVVFINDAILGQSYGSLEYFRRLFTIGAQEPYYYVPLLCGFYLLSPLIVAAARAQSKWLLSACAFVQLSAALSRYLYQFGVRAWGLDLLVRMTPYWSVPSWMFFFPLGVVAGLHRGELQAWLHSHRWKLLVSAAILFTVYVLESDVLLRRTWTQGMGSPELISYHPCALASLLCFLAFTEVRIPFSGSLYSLSRYSYGIYLMHFWVVESVARLTYHVAPVLLSRQSLFVPMLFALGLGLPLLLMAAVARSPMRRSYRYLFG